MEGNGSGIIRDSVRHSREETKESTSKIVCIDLNPGSRAWSKSASDSTAKFGRKN
jgi:hypothetical protein